MSLAAYIETDAVAPGITPVSPTDMLVLPMARAALLQPSTDADGSPVLTLYTESNEVSWDDPRQFPFAEGLVSGTPFQAIDSSQWSGLDWSEVAPMLAALLDEGILARSESSATCPVRHDNMPMPSPLPPAPMGQPRTWMDADPLMVELTGADLDTFYLETVVPVFRTGHLFLDRDGRHVGEANAFPAAARTDVPTEWRGCPYAGNRYQPEKPMNVTALRAMRAHWRQMMQLMLPIREAYLERFPEARNGWTVAHVERLTVCVLALPSYMMLRHDAPTANGDLHPALSNLFRVTDGLRMVMHHMLFVPIYEPMHAPDAPVTIDAILAYADRNYLFHSDHGVCAGPRFMIEDFLGTLLNGDTPRSGFDAAVDPELAAAANLIQPAMDYGLLGLQTFGTVFSVWPAMARCYADLHALLSENAALSDAAAALAGRFAGHFEALSFRSFLASEEWRQHREDVYDDMFAACAKGATGEWPDAPLSAQLAPVQMAQDGDAQAELIAAFNTHFGGDALPLAAQASQIVMTFLARARQTVALAETIQQRTGACLDRPAPTHRLTLQHLNLHNVLMGEDMRSVPFLPDELHRLLGIGIHANADTIQIVRASAPASTHSLDPMPADKRADAR